MITAEAINLKAREIGGISLALLNAGKEMVTRALELGELLARKREEINSQAPGTWMVWCSENLEFSKASEQNYRRLYANASRIRPALDNNEVGSLRAALALVASEMIEGDDGTRVETKPTTAPQTKVGSIFARLWRVFRDPSRLPEVERREFVASTAGAVRFCKENNWELPEI